GGNDAARGGEPRSVCLCVDTMTPRRHSILRRRRLRQAQPSGSFSRTAAALLARLPPPPIPRDPDRHRGPRASVTAAGGDLRAASVQYLFRCRALGTLAAPRPEPPRNRALGAGLACCLTSSARPHFVTYTWARPYRHAPTTLCPGPLLGCAPALPLARRTTRRRAGTATAELAVLLPLLA